MKVSTVGIDLVKNLFKSWQRRSTASDPNQGIIE